MDEKLAAAFSRIQDLEAKLAATEAVFIHLFTPLLSSSLQGDIVTELFAGIRADLIVSSSRADGGNAETAKLIIEEHINDLIDRVQRFHILTRR